MDIEFETATEYEYISPQSKVIARYTLHRQDPVDKVLEKIISNCLSAQIKAGDAPCSASTHLNSAIAALYEMIPDYNPDDEEMKAALEWAIDEGKILRGEKHV